MASRKAISGEADGVSAVAHEFDTIASMTTAGAKLLSIKNAGAEIFSIDKDGLTQGSFVAIVKPSAGGAGIEAALNAAVAAGGGIVQLLAGTYTLTSSFAIANPNGIILQGVGASSIMEIDGAIDGIAFNGTNVSQASEALDPISRGDTSIFTTTVGDAGSYQVGDTIRIGGTNNDSGALDAEVHHVAVAGNAGTGEIVLEKEVTKDYTANVALGFAWRDGNGVGVRDMQVIGINGANQALAFNNMNNILVERVLFSGMVVSMAPQSFYNMTMIDCRVENCSVEGVRARHGSQFIMDHCYILKTPGVGILMGRSLFDATIKNSSIEDCANLGISEDDANAEFDGSTINLRWNIINNIFSRHQHAGIQISGVNDVLVKENHFIDSAYRTTSSGFAAIRVTGDRVRVVGNIVNQGRGGIKITGDDLTITHNIVSKTREYGFLIV
jgi:hypothetical protein